MHNSNKFIDIRNHSGYIHSMTLNEYLTQNNVTNAQFAREGGWQRSVVGKWRNGDRRPQRTEDLDKILRLTHGKVTANDFYMNRSVKDGI